MKNHIDMRPLIDYNFSQSKLANWPFNSYLLLG